MTTLSVGCGSSKSKKHSRAGAGVTSGTTGTTNSNGTGTTNSGSTGGGGGGGGGGTSGVGSLSMAEASITSSLQSLMAPDLATLVLNARAQGGAIELDGFIVTASGTTDDTRLGELKLWGDDNQNGVLDPGDPLMGTVPAPAFVVDDGSVQLNLNSPVTVAAGQSVQLIVTIDASAAGASSVAQIGSTLQMSVVSQGDVTASSGGVTGITQGSFPLLGPPLTLYVHDHLLISEIVRMGTGGEYMEILNPTAAPIALDDYYLTDGTDDVAPGLFYQNMPSGQDFVPTQPSDFVVRFPAGTTLGAGQLATIATTGSGFQGVYSQSADYCLREPAGGAVQMLTPDPLGAGGWSPSPSTGGLRNAGEGLMLFTWDGQSDLVQDVDYVFWGSESVQNARVVKSPSMGVDGPDADTLPSVYSNDTDAFQQKEIVTTSFPNNAVQRIDFTEAGETWTGGNGAQGHDETSEGFDTNFVNGPPSPGRP